MCQVGKLFIVETNELISCSTSLVEAEMSDRKCKSLELLGITHVHRRSLAAKCEHKPANIFSPKYPFKKLFNHVIWQPNTSLYVLIYHYNFHKRRSFKFILYSLYFLFIFANFIRLLSSNYFSNQFRNSLNQFKTFQSNIEYMYEVSFKLLKSIFHLLN